ncbi:MAG: hypothetical protein A2Y17_07385 [Clostridiales bacterium GWF2_38_85]|nr:MAG: hypothetical protein A2Y17_07385 [Clostridiales bacterium GWF2_38_85]HBL84305.1 hypothetical protein [Clostridiales bacterium]
MKILWITNIPIGLLSIKINGNKANGLWMDASLQQFINNEEHNIAIVTTGKVKKTLYLEDKQVTYWLLPGGNASVYKRKSDVSKKEWLEIFIKEKPDIIQIWGTEYGHSYNALLIAKERNIPTVIYMQGVIDAIARYCVANMTIRELFHAITLRDLYRRKPLITERSRFERNAKREKELMRLAEACIVENKWCDLHCRILAPESEIYYIPLDLNQVFYEYQWDVSKAEQHSIMCNASGYPAKGLHIMLKALVILKAKYPDVILYVPGPFIPCGDKLIERQKSLGYRVYITDIIKKLDLKKNIIFTGALTPEEIARKLSMVRVFVMASAIENHSSSLKEAMTVGTPCVSSDVGGVSEYVINDVNGFLYRFEEYEKLAYHISQLFNKSELCLKFSEKCRTDTAKSKVNVDIYKQFTSVYEQLIEIKDAEYRSV